MKIVADASLPLLDKIFPEPFTVTTYENLQELKAKLNNHSILLCRSTLTVDARLLESSSLRYVATASSGSDHIDKVWLQSQGIKWLDAKGSNAVSVADYVTASIIYLQKQGINTGKKAGIIGFGAVGKVVLSRLEALGFSTVIYDPPLALRNKNFKSCSLEDLSTCDLIGIHAELQDHLPYPSRNLLARDFLKTLKHSVIIINAARGGIINEEDLLNTSSQPIYCTDVYCNEPTIDPRIVRYATLCTPHIAGHSLEAKSAAVIQISKHLHEAFGLIFPKFERYFPEISNKINPEKPWSESILSLYDPGVETILLKNALDYKNVFLALRKAHNKRHDFAVYGLNI